MGLYKVIVTEDSGNGFITESDVNLPPMQEGQAVAIVSVLNDQLTAPGSPYKYSTVEQEHVLFKGAKP